MMIVLIEGVVLCFVLLLVCVINIKDGPIGGVHYYEEPVQERVVSLGLISRKQIRKNLLLSSLALYTALLAIAPFMVFYVNGARTFKEGFLQLLVMFLECGLFDRLFIDWYWVSHTKAWIIEGTEDLRPYIHLKSWTIKIAGTLIVYPLLAALLSLICTALFR